MRKIIKNKNLVPVTIADLNLDDTPDLNSTDPVTSRGVATAITEAVGGASDALQEQIDDIAEKAGSGYTPKGHSSVATLNGLSGQENGWLYTMTDAGTLTDGSLAVTAGDTVAWDETNSVWYKAMDYAPAQYGTNKIKNLPTSITAFRTGDVIPVDGQDGTAKMSKDSLLAITAQNAVDSGIAASKVVQDEQLETGVIVTAHASTTISAGQESNTWPSIPKAISTGDVIRIRPSASSAEVVDNYRVYSTASNYVNVPINEEYVLVATKNYEAGVNSHLIRLMPFDFNRSEGVVIGGSVSFEILFIPAAKAASYVLELTDNSTDIYEPVEDVVYSEYVAAGSITNDPYYLKRGLQPITFGTQNYWSHVVLPVSPGEVYRIKSVTSDGGVGKPIAYTVDSTLTILRASSVYQITSGETILECDARTAYIVVEAYNGQTSTLLDKLVITKVRKRTFGVENFERINKLYNKKVKSELTFDSHDVGRFPTSQTVGNTITYSTEEHYQHNIYSVTEGKQYFISIATYGDGQVGAGAVAELDANGKVLVVHYVTQYDKNLGFEILLSPVSGCTTFVVNYFGNRVQYGRQCFVLEVEDSAKEVSCGSSIPRVNAGLRQYYDAYLETKKASIETLEGACLNKFSFLWLTDSHWEANGLQSKFLCQKLLEDTPAEFVVHGGDFARAYGSSTALKSDFDETSSFIDVVGRERLMVLRGNHDFTIKTSADSNTGSTYPNGKTLAEIRNKCRYNVVRELGKYYFYVELMNGVVLVFLCTSDTQSADPDAYWGVNYSVSQDQVDWLENLIKSKTNTKFVFFEHIACHPDFTGGYSSVTDVIKNIIDAVNSGTGDYADINNQVVACFSGHSHKDQEATENGCAYVGTTSDAAYQDTGVTRTIGTTSEQAIDYVVLDFDNEQVSTVRIGGGSDRTVSWATT